MPQGGFQVPATHGQGLPKQQLLPIKELLPIIVAVWGEEWIGYTVLGHNDSYC